ncbi:MAG: amidophosphoribosyltransferase [Anaerolineales bacterium]
MSNFDDSPREECGIIGVFAPNEDVARMTFFGLFALQHRGQEAAGMAVADGQTISLYKNVGLVGQVFTPETLSGLKGHYSIGHTRYSTTGSSLLRNAQPFMIETMYGPLALGHNGNLVNSAALRAEMLRQGVGFSSSSDSEVMTMMLARDSGPTWEARIKDAMKKWVGAYSLVILTRNCVYAVRDPWGFRPLSVGMLPNGGYAVASETGALRTLGCEAIRDVLPGEIVTLSANALTVTQALPAVKPSAKCVFEHIYFARPDQTWEGVGVHAVRQRLGEELAREWVNGEAELDNGGNGETERNRVGNGGSGEAERNRVGNRGSTATDARRLADVVIPVPDSSIPAAIGFARVSGIPYNDGFVKNRYVGRTFIEPTDSLRKRGVGMKFNVISENVQGKRVIVIDDSIVRGNTTGPLIQLLRQAGAKEVHVCITCPPIMHPCFMGVDMGGYEDLIAHNRTVEEIRRAVGADSLTYLSLEGMMRAVGSAEGYCQACFTGKYPVPVDLSNVKTGFERGTK